MESFNFDLLVSANNDLNLIPRLIQIRIRTLLLWWT